MSNYQLLPDSQAHHDVLKKNVINKIYNSVALCATQQIKIKFHLFNKADCFAVRIQTNFGIANYCAVFCFPKNGQYGSQYLQSSGKRNPNFFELNLISNCKLFTQI